MITVLKCLSESPEITAPGSGVGIQYGGLISDWGRCLYDLGSSSLHLKGSEEVGTVIGFLAVLPHWCLQDIPEPVHPMPAAWPKY